MERGKQTSLPSGHDRKGTSPSTNGGLDAEPSNDSGQVAPLGWFHNGKGFGAGVTRRLHQVQEKLREQHGRQGLAGRFGSTLGFRRRIPLPGYRHSHRGSQRKNKG